MSESRFEQEVQKERDRLRNERCDLGFWRLVWVIAFGVLLGNAMTGFFVLLLVVIRLALTPGSPLWRI